MTAFEIIKKASILLNEKNILDDESLLNIDEQNQEDLLEQNFTLNRMFELLKIMILDIASEHVQLVREEDFESVDGVIDMTTVGNLLKVVEVRKNGVKLPIKMHEGKLAIAYDGMCKVKYLTAPNVVSLLDEVDEFKGLVGYDLLIYGLASMYCLAVGMFDEYGVYNEIYEQKMAEVKSLKILNMPMRSWR